MTIIDITRLIHPAIAVVVVFPILGIVLNYAWQTRSRRLQVKAEGKSKIPPLAGPEHLRLGRWLTGAVVGVALLGLAHPIFKNILINRVWQDSPFKVAWIVLMFAATIAALVCLYRANQRVWRGVFATLTGMGLVILGTQDGIFRRTNEWYISHYYFGITAALLMIFSLAIVPDIYQDRSNRWRRVHAALNCFAILLFMGQGVTGTRDLLEIPLSWQEQHLYQCDFLMQSCPSSPTSNDAPSQASPTDFRATMNLP